jgi:predicted DNA-binding antitoxin AbrB/MazE fold protein
MTTIDAVYTNGRFEPLTPVNLTEQERMTLSVRRDRDVAAALKWFEECEIATRGMTIQPDSAADIAKDRQGE